MASGTLGNTWRAGAYRVQIDWSSTPNTDGNYSDVVTYYYLISLGSSWTISSTAGKSLNVIVDGQSFPSTVNVSLSGNQTKLLGTVNKRVYHNPDGTKNFGISGTLAINVTISGTYYGTISIDNVNFNLDNIPRATTPILNYSTREMGQVIRVTTNPASSGFSHKIYYSFTGIGNTLIATLPTGNQYNDWTIPTATLAPKIPSALSGIVTITAETYSGATLIGSKSVTFTATVPDYQPTASLSLTGVDLYSTYYVQAKSKVSVSITSAGLYGSTISTRTTTANGSTYTTATFTTGALSSSGTNTISTIVTDSRGKSRTVSGTITVQAYTNPQAISLSVVRCLVDGTLNEEGGYAKVTIQSAISSILSTNTRQTLVKYKLKSSGTYTTLINNITDYSVSTSGIFTADVNSQYDVLLEVADYYTTTSRTAPLGVAFTLMDFNSDGKGIGIGKVAEGNGILDIRGDTYTEGNVNVDGDLNLEGNANLNGVTNALGLISAIAGMNLSAPVEPMKIRYIRDYLTSASTSDNRHWNEVQALTLDGTNRALNKPVTGSAIITNANYVTNGDLTVSQYAEIMATGSQYVQIDLGAVYTDIVTIKSWHYWLDIRWYNGHKIEVSEDGVNWIKIYDVANTGVRTETSSGITAKVPNTKPLLISGGGNNKVEYIGYADGTSDILINNVPLINSGSNGLGYWVRYYDGTQICYSWDVTAVSGGNATTGTSIGLPTCFIDTAKYSISSFVRGIASAGVSGSFVMECYPQTRGTIVIKVLVHTPTTIYNGGGYGCTYQAIGRWY